MFIIQQKIVLFEIKITGDLLEVKFYFRVFSTFSFKIYSDFIIDQTLHTKFMIQKVTKFTRLKLIKKKLNSKNFIEIFLARDFHV